MEFLRYQSSLSRNEILEVLSRNAVAEAKVLHEVNVYAQCGRKQDRGGLLFDESLNGEFPVAHLNNRIFLSSPL